MRLFQYFPPFAKNFRFSHWYSFCLFQQSPQFFPTFSEFNLIFSNSFHISIFLTSSSSLDFYIIFQFCHPFHNFLVFSYFSNWSPFLDFSLHSSAIFTISQLFNLYPTFRILLHFSSCSNFSASSAFDNSFLTLFHIFVTRHNLRVFENKKKIKPLVIFGYFMS